MTTSFLLAERDTAFHMRRPTLANGNFVSDVDSDVTQKLTELDELLGKHVLSGPGTEENGQEDTAESRKAAAAAAAHAVATGEEIEVPATPAKRRRKDLSLQNEAMALLAMPLAPWRPTAEILKQGWPKNSLADFLAKAVDDENKRSLADHIDLVPELSELKYDFIAKLDSGWYALDANTRAVLEDRPNVQNYLVARAYYVGRIREPKALYNYIMSNRNGVSSIVDYVAVSAARSIIERKRLRVPNYHEDGEAFTQQVKESEISFSRAAFSKTVEDFAEDVMYNTAAISLLSKATVGTIPEDIKPKLIHYIKTSKVPITPSNINLFLPSFIARAHEYDPDYIPEEDDENFGDTEASYKVQFQDRPGTESDVNRDAVRFAAQLFHGMVIGEELGVFDAFQYLLHSRMLVGGGMEVRDKTLRNDLRMYALSNEYRDLGRPGQPTEERTRASERKMFARVVFAQGDGELLEGMQENIEFRQLWQVLMLESARYLEKAQEAFNPASFVSKQNVMQAIEDLQYNLSTHCVGWPQVMAPAIDAELNFILTRFISNEKIAQQVLPAGGSWKRVIDKLNSERPKKAPIPAAALLYTKAWQGMQILERIADYDPANYENEREFSAFIGLVDAYITTESKLQRRGPPRRRYEEPAEEEEELEADNEALGGEKAAAPAEAADDWDF